MRIPSSLSSSWQAGSGLVLQVQGKHNPLGQWWRWRLVKIVPLSSIHTWDKWEPPFARQVLLAAITKPLSSSFKPIHSLQYVSALQGPVTQPEQKSCTSPLHAWTRLLVRPPHCFSDAACCPSDVRRKFFTRPDTGDCSLLYGKSRLVTGTPNPWLWEVLA